MMGAILGLLKQLGPVLVKALPKPIAVALTIAFSVAVLLWVVAPIVERRLASDSPQTAITPVVVIIFDAALIFVMIVVIAIVGFCLAYFIYWLCRRR